MLALRRALHLAARGVCQENKLDRFYISEGSWFSGRASHSHRFMELTVVIWEGPGFDSRRVQFFISGISIYGPFYLSTLAELGRA